MIPLRSSERTYTPATVTLILIALNVAVFFFELSLGPWNRSRFIALYGLVPARFHLSTLFTCMFLHGGWLHILGNMWFLWIFGKGIEDLIGHGRFLFFYLACGVLAGLTHVALNIGSDVPTIGASGAIAGVMGAYLVKFPRARIVTLVPIFIFFTTLEIPAVFLLLYWFAIQFFSGYGSIAGHIYGGDNTAWFAHIGGFVAGMLVILMMPTQQRWRRWYQ
ncbi:MAG TPA: rhomboid family intramembrane serine protease [Bryobacteraceae bacterium]|jgi:membrane associated rhomboid family serine protease|nr:rhomboid family intramembrane serine protease [Bryobacteraceae bacterium]